MSEPPEDRRRPGVALLMTLYLLAVTVATFALPAAPGARSLSWYVVPALLAAQVFVLLACRGGTTAVLRAVWRLKWFFVFLMLCYALLPAADRAPDDPGRSWKVPGTPWTVALHLSGLGQAVLMCLQILTVVLASAVVRLTGSGTDLVDGLRTIGLPALFVHSFDLTLDLLGGDCRPGSSGRPGSGAPAKGRRTPARSAGCGGPAAPAGQRPLRTVHPGWPRARPGAGFGTACWPA